MRANPVQRVIRVTLMVMVCLAPLLGTVRQAQAGWYDAPTGLYYKNARWYNPKTGRWLQRDPNGVALVLANNLAMNGQSKRAFASLDAWAQYADGLNLYQYVGSNPGNATDPGGMQTQGFDYFAAQESLIAMRQAAAFATIARFSFIARRTAQIAGRLAFQTAITAIVPGAGLYFAARGLADSIEDIGANGFTWGNSLMAGVSVVGLPGAAIGTFRQSKQLIRSVRNFRANHVRLQMRQQQANRASADIQKHHPIPKFLGGDVRQVLKNIDAGLHRQYHRLLNIHLKLNGVTRRAGGSGGSQREWARYFRANPGSQEKAFDAVLDSARTFDELYGTDLTSAVWTNLMQGNFKPLP